MKQRDEDRERGSMEGGRNQKKNRAINIWNIIKVELLGLLGDHIRRVRGRGRENETDSEKERIISRLC